MSEHSQLPRAVAVMGPTAAGKEALGVRVAERLQQPVLVCDSVKVYRGLDIGSAKPSAQTRARVPHHLLDLVDPDETFSAVDYADHALRALDATGGVFVGGTGFYLRAAAWTQTPIPAELDRSADDPQRVALEATWRRREAAEPGAAWRALAAIDPLTADTIHPRNLVRIVRALWLCRICGGAISRARQADPPRPRVRLLLLVLDPGPALDARIAARVDAMIAAGWMAEVEKLREAGYDARHKAMRSLGYRQMLDVVEGRVDLETARHAIVTATRQYARRQRTYLRHQLPAQLVVHLTQPEDCPWDRVDAFARGEPDAFGVHDDCTHGPSGVPGLKGAS
jgi:tRNA dimethylallyltransferase